MNGWLRLAQACYHLMLRGYPRRFRAEYAAEMEAVLAQALGAAARQGPRHVAAICARELWAWPLAVLREHRRERGERAPEAVRAWHMAGAAGLTARADYSWVSAALFLGVVGGWGWVVVRQLAEQRPLPITVIFHGLALVIYALGLAAFARSRTAGQRVVALQASLVLSPGTGTLVSFFFWRLPGLNHAPGATTSTTILTYTAFSLPWLLLMFAPSLWRGARSALAARPTGMTVDWRLAGGWALATAAGWLLPHWVSTSTWAGPLLSAWVLMLVAPSLLQWLVLRGRLPTAGWRAMALWVLLSAGGLVAATYLSASRQLLDLYLNGRDSLDQVLAYSTFGTALGLAQWLVLRRWTPRAHWWILANLLAWPAGWGLVKLLALLWREPGVGGLEPALIAGVAGLLTGVALGYLLPARGKRG